jgi:hypothetical protein
MKVYDLQCLLNAVPQDYELLLNQEFPINEITVDYDNQELSLIVPEVIEEDEEEEEEYL